IIAAGNRSANLTRQLLAFARRQTISPETVDLNDAVDSMLKMLRRLIGENIDLVWRPRSGLWPVHIDSSQLDQLMANLCVNSRDAIQNVGQITIETDMKTVRADDKMLMPELLPGDYVTLSVYDNGCGMSKEVQSHIFEPFYTTKKAGEGTGLGLATVYGVVKQNYGFINISSEPGKGTAVTIFLPRHLEALLQKTSKPENNNEMHGNETILLVEDELSLLRMTSTTLRHFGYRVLASATPGEAIKILNSSNEQIQLLITDVVMPEMNGRDLARELKRIRPGLKVLFMSGYTDEVIANHGVLDNNINFIEKPFTMNDLATKTRAVLDKETD
ncbi:MAG: PAS/PAC sensor hybrid histidine kinase, partial [uncultured bacterium]